MSTYHQHSLFHLVDTIRLKKFKLSRSHTPQTDSEDHTPTKLWTVEQQKLFFNIIIMYGADYSILKHHFPTKSRKQIKRKCTEIQERRERAIEKAELKKVQEKRKDFFDIEVMQLNMIKWRNSKPNKPESASESEEN